MNSLGSLNPYFGLQITWVANFYNRLYNLNINFLNRSIK